MTRLKGNWRLHCGTQALCAALEGGGYRALFVGGCVRNDLLGESVSDIDIATDARPEHVARIALDAGFRVIETGLSHGTLTVIADGRPHEVTTFRRDVSTDGRRACVAFSAEIGEDAARRDFTMNALYADARGGVIDPLGCGLADLFARRLRFVGNAEARIREDYLRILRFFRFYAYYGDPYLGPDADALAACAQNIDGLEALSKERIGAEMRKLLSAPEPVPALALMATTGALAQILPGASASLLGPFEHIYCDVFGLKPADSIIRLAVIGGETPQANLRLSRAEARRLNVLRSAAQDLQEPGAFGYRLGLNEGLAAFALRCASVDAPPCADAAAKIARGAAQVFPVAAADLPDYRGAALGARLKRLEQRWIASDFTLERAALLSKEL